jgi:hypothetical protein
MSAILFSNPFITPPPPPVPTSGAGARLGVAPARGIYGSSAEGGHSGQSGNGRQGGGPPAISRTGPLTAPDPPRPAKASAASVVLAMSQMLARRHDMARPYGEAGLSVPLRPAPFAEKG